MLIAVGGLALLVLLSFSGIVPGRWLVVFLVVIRSLCDYGVVFQSRPAILGYISLAVTVVAIYAALMQSMEGRLYSRHLTLFIFPVLCVGLWSIVAYSQFGLRSSLYSETLRIVSIVAILCFAASITPSRREFETLTMIMGMPAVVLGLISAAGWIPYGSISLGRLTSTFSHPNSAGAFFGLLTVILFYLWLTDSRKLIGLCLVLSSSVLVLTGSLGSVVGTIIGILLGMVLVIDVSVAKRVSIAFSLALALAIAYKFFGLSRRVAEFDIAGRSASVGQSPDSMQWRFQNWQELLALWSERPLLGYGLGSTASIVTPLGGPPHSLYVQILVEWGLIGSALIIALVARLTVMSVRIHREGYWQGAVLLGCISFVAVNGFVSNTLGYSAMIFLLVACCGFLIGSHRTDLSGAVVEGKKSAYRNQPNVSVMEKA